MKRLIRIMKILVVSIIVGGAAVGIMDLLRRRGEERKAKETRTYIHKTYGPYERYFKRPLDFMLSAGALVVLSPLMVVIAILVKVKLGSPVLFMQERPGRDGKIFRLYKFRTMTDTRDEKGELLPDEERLGSFGKILRKTSLDELPQLLNILRGDMSIIGPRPLLVQYLPFYNENEKHRHDVRPGLTGLAQVNGRNNLNWNMRFETDVAYANHVTFMQDMTIVLKTVGEVLSHSGVLEDTSKGETNFAVERGAENEEGMAQ